MTASELRLGNYVDYNCCCENKITVKVESISKDKLWMIDDAKNYHCTKCGETFYNNVVDFFDPIQLTEEFLSKFGFIWCTGRHGVYYMHEQNILFRVWYFDNGWIVGRKDEEHKDRKYNTHWIKLGIQYVHQLQNLYFALTGEELTLKTE